MPEGRILAPPEPEGHDLKELPLDDFTTDKAFYAALKLHVYGTVHDGVLRALLAGRTLLLDQAVRLEVGRFTARKASHLFVSESGARGHASAEFHGFTSHKVREKLAHFHDLGVVELLGKGLRDAHTYRWREPLRHWEVCSFMRFRARTGEDLTLNLELHRLHRERGMAPFTAKDFVDMYARVHGAEYGGSRWGRRKWERIAGSFEYGESVRARLDRLMMAGLVVRGSAFPQETGDLDVPAGSVVGSAFPAETLDHDVPRRNGVEGAALRIDPTLRDALHHFDLFLEGAPYRASPAMCAACPLDALCRAGSTQRALVALRQP